jgi:hypothetical protein
MKKQFRSDRKVNILYNGKKLYENAPIETVPDRLLELAEKCYDGAMDYDLIEIQYVR